MTEAEWLAAGAEKPMTDSEWLTSYDGTRLTYFVSDWMSLRKLRLVNIFECRQLEQELIDARSKHALDVAEMFADGLVGEAALLEASTQAAAAYESLKILAGTERDKQFVAALQACIATGDSSRMRMNFDMVDIAVFASWPEPISLQVLQKAKDSANKVRDIFGNPFRPVAFAAEWRTAAAVALAESMYQARDFAAMPILADALQDAGCENEDILSHCRGLGPHVRGCWVVDLVTERE